MLDSLNSEVFSALVGEIQSRLELTENDKSFLGRVFSTDLEAYAEQLVRLGFAGNTRVLDAGCGFGQWSLVLANLNEKVVGLDSSSTRTEFLSQLAAAIGQRNIKTAVGALESLPFRNRSFDAIFCFGTVFLTDWTKALDEFARVLAPGGKLFLTFNDIGWYVNCWVNRPNEVSDYSPREVAASALRNALDFQINGSARGERVISPEEMTKELLKRHFLIEHMEPEQWRGRGSFFGLGGVYEVRASVQQSDDER